MTIVHTIILSILQGISELFPISSLGHAVLLPRLLHWSLSERGPNWLAFLVALHIGTATALLIYFRDDWLAVVAAFVRSVRRGQMGQSPSHPHHLPGLEPRMVGLSRPGVAEAPGLPMPRHPGEPI